MAEAAPGAEQVAPVAPERGDDGRLAGLGGRPGGECHPARGRGVVEGHQRVLHVVEQVAEPPPGAGRAGAQPVGRHEGEGTACEGQGPLQQLGAGNHGRGSRLEAHGVVA